MNNVTALHTKPHAINHLQPTRTTVHIRIPIGVYIIILRIIIYTAGIYLRRRRRFKDKHNIRYRRDGRTDGQTAVQTIYIMYLHIYKERVRNKNQTFSSSTSHDAHSNDIVDMLLYIMAIYI